MDWRDAYEDKKRTAAEALIGLAHPDDRDQLREEGRRLGIL